MIGFRLVPASTVSRAIVSGLLVMSAWSATAASSHPACEPAKATKATLDRLAELASGCPAEPASCWRQRKDLLASALEERSEDLFLHRAYQDVFRARDVAATPAEQAELLERYQRLAAAEPKTAQHLYLEGRLLNEEPEKARQAFARALELDATFPWAHFALAMSSRDPGVFVLTGDAASHLQRFLQLCPTRVGDVLQSMPALKGETGLAPIVAEARALLSRRRDPQAVAMYPALWKADFQAMGEADLEPARQRIAGELVRIEKLKLEDRDEYWSVLAEGRDLVRDFTGAGAARRELMRRFPCHPTSREIQAELLEEELPEPAESATQEERQAWASAMYERAKALTVQCPDALLFARYRFGAAMSLNRLTDEEGLAEMEAMLAPRSSTMGLGLGSWTYRRAAQFLLARKLDTQRVQALAKQMREEAEAAYARRAATRGLPESLRANFERMRVYELWEADKIELRARVAAGQFAEALSVLDEMGRSMGEKPQGERPQGAGAMDEDLLFYTNQAVERAVLEGEILAAMGSTLDALAMYRYAFDLRREVGGKPKAEELAAARRLWDELGGGNDVWTTFSQGGGAASATKVASTNGGWKSLEKPLPELSLRDLGGKVWTSADLQGKSVLINAWATWCAPCQVELPHIQKLYEQFKDDPKVLVLTLNVDENLGAVEPFVAKKQLTVPALLGADYFQEMYGGFTAIPRNWLLSPDGMIRREQMGFSPGEAEEWRDEVARQLAAGVTGSGETGVE